MTASPAGTPAPGGAPGAVSPGMAPRLIGALARGLVRIFYRRVEVVGLERVPGTGPLIVAANHRNALVDPLLLLATLPRPLRPLAKAPLFRHPLFRPFLRLAGALPVERRQDPGSDPSRNVGTFRAVAAALDAGEAILIFPEGVSQSEPLLMPLRTGVARMILGTDAGSTDRAPRPPPTLLPVGLNFHEPGTFRDGWGLVLVGPPVSVEDQRALARVDPQRAVRELTDRLALALRALVVEATDRETLRLAQGLEALRRAERGDAGGPPAEDATQAEQVGWVQAALRAYRWLAEREPARVGRFRGDVERYLTDVARVGLAPAVVGRDYPPGVARRYAVREGLALLGGMPLALWGVASHALPYALTDAVARRFATSPDVEATAKLGAGLLLYPCCWAVEAWAVRTLLGVVPMAVFLLALIPTGFLALGWRARLDRVRRDARAYFRFLRDRDLLARLAARRRALVAEAEGLGARVPPTVLAGAGSDPPGEPSGSGRPR